MAHIVPRQPLSALGKRATIAPTVSCPADLLADTQLLPFAQEAQNANALAELVHIDQESQTAKVTAPPE